MKYLIGIDVGTTGTKTLLFDQEKNIIKRSYYSYKLNSPKPGYAEQNPEEWYKAVINTVLECVEDISEKETVEAISISAQGGAMAAVDVTGKAVKPAVSWLDRRAKLEAEKLCKNKEENYYYKKTGWRLNDGYNLAQILWMKTHEQDKYNQTALFMSTLDYLNFRLTGRAVADYTSMGITNLENIHTWTWDKSIFRDLQINEEQLPHICQAGTAVGMLTEKAAKEMGLTEKTIVVNGGYDQYCAALGVGAIHKGDLMLSTGTAWVLMGITDELKFDEKSYISPCRHIVPGVFGTMASLETGGVSLDWLRNRIISGEKYTEEYDIINREIEKRRPGADGILFYPHFAGTTCPTWSKNNKASFLGITLFHDKYHIARAVMEGVVFEMYGILKAYENAGINIGKIKLVGGASRSRIWTQMIADITQMPVEVYGNADAAAIGAGIIAAIGAGWYKSYEEACTAFSQDITHVLPNKENAELYKNIYEKYKQGFMYLKEFYDKEA